MAMACVASPEKWKNGGKKPSVATTLVVMSGGEAVLAAELELGVAVLVEAVAVRDDVRVAPGAAAQVARHATRP